MDTPVAFLIFNRPDVTARVFEAIRQARPPQLLIVADGPRADRPGEAGKCAATREVVARVDWDCDVRRRFSDVNLGCGPGVASGLDWVFGQVDRAIVLEDDCLPDPSFFPFCEELLEKYRDDERVMNVLGSNFRALSEPASGRDSYRFSRFHIPWGWATWRRAWRFYDMRAETWPEAEAEDWLSGLFRDPRDARFWARTFGSVHGKARPHTWDYQWTFACWRQSGLSIAPRTHLVSNIGFGPEATHTTGYTVGADSPTQPVAFPLRHPSAVVRDAALDDYIQHIYYRLPLPARARRKFEYLTLKAKRRGRQTAPLLVGAARPRHKEPKHPWL